MANSLFVGLAALTGSGVVLASGVAVSAVVLDDSTTRAQVVKVVDGDTIDVRYDDSVRRVRLLNIDTPEMGGSARDADCLAEEATQFLRARLPSGTRVTLLWDEERTDRYGRELRGVRAEGDLVNAAVARAGFAVPMHIAPNDRFLDEVTEAVEEARTQRRGLFDPVHGCTIAGRQAAAEQAASSGDQTRTAQHVLGARAILSDDATFGARLYDPRARSALLAELKALPAKAEKVMQLKQRAAEKKAAEKRAAEKRAAEKRAAEKRAAEKRAAEKRAAEKRASQASPPVAPSPPPPVPQRPAPSSTQAPPVPAPPKPRPGNAAPCRSYAPGGKTFIYIDCDTKQPL